MKRLLCLVLLLLLCGCSAEPPAPPAPTPTPEPPFWLDAVPTPTKRPRTDSAPFALRYDPADSLNPYTCRTETNRQLTGLLFETLFAVGSDFSLEAGLCAGVETDDGGRSYTFTLREDACFWDGSTLDAWDAVYSLNRARESGSHFAARLQSVQEVCYIDTFCFSITLERANPRFLLRLEVPVVQEGSAYSDLPVGSGPYRPELEGDCCLQAVRSGLPVERVELRTLADGELLPALRSGELSLLLADPEALGRLGALSGISRRSVPTSILTYLQVEPRSAALEAPERRRLVNAMLDRDELAAALGGKSALLPFCPSSGEYAVGAVEEWLSGQIPALCIRYLTEDYDGDGTLEYLRDGLPEDFALTLLACMDDDLNAAAVRSLEAQLSRWGVAVTVKLLEEDAFREAYAAGSYDLCLCSRRLTADFDLTGLLVGCGDGEAAALAAEYAAAEEQQAAGDALGAYLLEHCPILPLCFRQYTILYQGGIEGFFPTWTDPFHQMTLWKWIA